MSFAVRKLAYRPWPVEVTLQKCNSSGDVAEIKNTFVGHFRPFTEACFEHAVKTARAAHPVIEGEDEDRPPMPILLRRNADVFAQLMCGWGAEVTDEAGIPIPFSEAALIALVTGPDGLAVSVGINTALNQIRFGVAPAKNASTSPAPGPVSGVVEAAPTN